jgi:hypothetical protein
VPIVGRAARSRGSLPGVSLDAAQQTDPAPPACPGCGRPLQEESDDDGKRTYPCPGCKGMLCGIAIFRSIAGGARAREEWRAALAEGGTGTGGPCPFCSRRMKAAPVEKGRVWTCATCEMVWVDHDALAFFETSTPGAGRADGKQETEPMTCANCGAPLQHSWDEKCAFCGAAIVRERDPEPVLDAEPPADMEHSFWEDLGDAFDTGISGRRGWWHES